MSSVAQAADPQLYRIEQDGLYGFMDSTGRVVIAPRFVWVTDFQEGRAVAMICGGDAYIDESGAIVEAPSIRGKALFSEGLAPFKRGGKVGFRDIQGQVVIQPRFEEAFHFSDGFAPVKVSGKWGYIDPSGRFARAPEFLAASPFKDGFAVVEISDDLNQVIDQTFQPVFRKITWRAFRWPSEGLLAFSDGDLFGYVQINGKVQIAPRFEDAYEFSEGLAPAQVNGKFGFINKSGEFLIPPQFDQTLTFSHGLAAVSTGDSWGFVDSTGQFVITPFAEFVTSFDENGIARAWAHGGSGYISRTGTRLLWNDHGDMFDHAPLFGFSKASIKKSCKGLEKKYPAILHKALKDANE